MIVTVSVGPAAPAAPPPLPPWLEARASTSEPGLARRSPLERRHTNAGGGVGGGFGGGALGSIVHLTGAGEIWAREQFSRRDRSMVVISALTAMGREVELRQHIGGGLNHGLTRDEIDEIMV